MKIKSRASADRRSLLQRLRGAAAQRWLLVTWSVLLFAGGVAAHRSGLLRTALDFLSRNAITYAYRRVSGLFVTPERLIIDIAHKDFMRLAHQRDIALERQVLVTSDDDAVPALVRHDDRTIPVRIRLKGDLVDHLEGDKWSFRIIARSDSVILGMKQFSVQHPQTRDFLNERMYHEVMRREGLIALRYEFVDLTLNGKDLGVYALEESFETRLIEFNHRKDGPVIRFDEDVLWGELARQVSVPPQQRVAVAGAGTYLSSDIDAFQTSKWLADPTARAQYLTAIHLLDAFRRREVSVDEAFDSKQLATFFALSDLLSAWHGVGNWPNARFYYNSITSRLEPIAFDGYNRSMPGRPGLLALQAMDEERDPAARQYISQFFADSAFYRLYLSELERVSDPEYVKALISDVSPKLGSSLRLLHREFPTLEFSWRPLRRSAEFIRIALHPPQGVQAYLRAARPGLLEVDVANMQALPLRVLGLARDSAVWGASPLPLPGKNDHQPLDFQTLRIAVPASLAWPDTLPAPLRMQYQVLGSDRVDEVEVHPWAQEADPKAIREGVLRRRPNVRDFAFLQVDETSRRIGIRRGSWRVGKDLIIPAGYRVTAGPGTRLDLVNGASIISRSPLELRGDPASPVIIESSDRTGQGVAVLQAGAMSVLEHVQFIGLANPMEGGWGLTGAVGFYESPVTVTRTRFAANRSEDALHIMRAPFTLEDVTFEDTFSDALDIDFGKGTIRRVTFLNCGNDGVDVSGAVVDIEDMVLRGAGDKGLSAGEGSFVNARNVTITDAAIGVASKDRSTLRVRGIRVIGGQVGVTAYRKKSEFGPGVIELTGLEMSGQKAPFLVERLSSVTVDGRAKPADLEKVADMLYGAEYGKSSH